MEIGDNFRPFDIHKELNLRLESNLVVPSAAHGYSICIEFMRDYFLKKFNKDYFKSVYVDTKYILDEYRLFDKANQIKKAKPLVAIVPEVDLTFDQEGLDTPLFGVTKHAHPFKDSFFKDRQNYTFLGLDMELLLMNFTFRLRLSTRAQQLDVYKRMKLAFRVGLTEGRTISMDFHVPYELMLRLAAQMKFEVKDNKIIDIIGFTRYLNKHSQYPFIYKFRPMTGNDEFFLRIDGIYVHIKNEEISAGDGEREGFLMHNFDIEMRSVVRFPVPKYYIHYSQQKFNEIVPSGPPVKDAVLAHALVWTDIPDWNEKGWDLYLTTEYDDDCIKDQLIIPFKDYFANTDIGRVIDQSNKLFISPMVFLDLKVYNNGLEISGEMDWNTLEWKATQCVTHTISSIAIYVDLNYLHLQIENMDNQTKNRVADETVGGH